MRLKDKIALITGAGGGIGSATVKRFAEEGATVILSDINEKGCEKVLKEIEEKRGKGSIILADVTKEDEIVSLFSKVKKDYERLDILANIAGGDFENQVAVDEISYEKMSYNIDANLKSCILCCREAAKIMMEQQYGKIVNMSSLVYRGSPMQFTYSAAKGGVFAFTRSMALTLGMYNITVNGLAPALVEVDIIKNSISPEVWEALKEDCATRYPLGRIGQPVDVANCALFLASDESSFITGQVIEISGGGRL
ncbi:MAG: SDR family oxidoreductase [Deltaproteobacteria bacterium]|nr:SDR family oxidoreductase [Deltaproteobacteria bacterium]